MTERGELMSIDDLLSGSPSGQEPAAPAPARKSPVRLLSLLLLTAVWSATALGLLRIFDLTAPIPVIIGAALTITLIGRLVRGLRPPPMRQPGRAPMADTHAADDGLRAAVGRWETVLNWSDSDVARFKRKVLPRLEELADERLRQRHGISRATDPDRARELLGDEVWAFLAAPGRRQPQPKELELVVKALEKL